MTAERDTILRELMEKEIRRFQVLLLYKERQQLKRGEYETIARMLIRRMKLGYVGLVLLITVVAMWSVPGGFFEAGWRAFPAVVTTAVAICLITYMAHGWGRLSGSMTAVLSMLGKDEEAEGRADAT